MLTKILEQMIQSFKETGAVQRRKLKSGLHITLIGHSTKYVLILWRNKVFPSDKEWETVLKFWPYQVERIEPKRIMTREKIPTLRGDIPAQGMTQRQLV